MNANEEIGAGEGVGGELTARRQSLAAGDGEDRSVVAAGGRDGDELIDGAARSIGDGEGEGFVAGLTFCEVIDRAVIDGVGPADGTVAITGGVVGNGGGECA